MTDIETRELVKKLMTILIRVEPKMAKALRLNEVMDYAMKHGEDEGTAVEMAIEWASENEPQVLTSIDLPSLGLGILIGAALQEIDNKPL